MSEFSQFLRNYLDEIAIKSVSLPDQLSQKEIAIVIAAYKEKDNIASVLESLNHLLVNLGFNVIVVVDGDDDSTGETAKSFGAIVAVNPFNRGQGAALRVGYQLAEKIGARIIVTLDADGQSDPLEIPGLIRLLKEQQADIVIGSRRRGSWEKTSFLRFIGIYFFAVVISFLIGQPITDPANPLRAFKVDVITKLNLTQDQYQAPEVIIKTKLLGYKIIEAPVKNLHRKEGRSKKPNGILYGFNFTKSIITSYLEAKALRKSS